MEPTDVTIEILKGIRSEAQKTNERLDMTNDRLDRIERRQTASEIRLATELAGVAGAVLQVRDLLREDRAVRVQVADHEQRITAIEKRTG